MFSLLNYWESEIQVTISLSTEQRTKPIIANEEQTEAKLEEDKSSLFIQLIQV